MDQQRFAAFSDVIEDFQDIREIIGDVQDFVKAKALNHIDPVARQFIERSPFMLKATYGQDGHVDISPKGDPAGFVQVYNENYLLIPDRPGNHRIDSFQNLMENPKIGLIFLIPGKAETLRIRGEARIIKDQNLREQMAVNGKVPQLITAVYVEEAFFHCPKCIIRSELWNSEAWPDTSDLPGIGEIMIAQKALKMTPDELQKHADDTGLTKMY